MWMHHVKPTTTITASSIIPCTLKYFLNPDNYQCDSLHDSKTPLHHQNFLKEPWTLCHRQPIMLFNPLDSSGHTWSNWIFLELSIAPVVYWLLVYDIWFLSTVTLWHGKINVFGVCGARIGHLSIYNDCNF